MTDIDPEALVAVNLPASLLRRLAAAMDVVDAEEVAARAPAYERQGKEFVPGTLVRLKGETAVTVSDTRLMVDDAGELVLDAGGRTVRNPLGRKVVQGEHSPDAPRQGVVVRHEPAAWTKTERRHVILMPNGAEVSADFEDIEEVSEPG